MKGILEGIKVIEMGHVVAIPTASAMLADWGAEVIKVEPLSGEWTRGVRRIYGVDRQIRANGNVIDWIFQVQNRNKKGIALDLKQKSGREILYSLIKTVDVFMSNYELSALTKLKVDYHALSKVNPKLIYAIITAFGLAGPDKDARGYEAAAWARSGIQYMIGQPGDVPPTLRPGMMDKVAASNIVAGILAALLHRGKTGQGQEVEVSLYHTGVWIMSVDIQAALMGLSMLRHERVATKNPIGNAYRTRDDRWIMLVMPQSDANWPNFCRAIDMPELEDDPRFKNMEMREQNCRQLIHILDGLFSSKDIEEWERHLREKDCIFGRVQTPFEVTVDSQALANGFFKEIQFADNTQVKMVTSPVNFRQNPASIRNPAPELSQHGEEILLNLGYSWDDIARLKEEKVLL